MRRVLRISARPTSPQSLGRGSLRALALGLALAGAAFACNSSSTVPDPDTGTHTDSAWSATREELVQTAQPRRGEIRSVVTTSGSVIARRSTSIGPAIPGRILHIFVQVGDEVPFGAPLFQIDPEPYAIALRDAEAGLALATAQLGEAKEEAERARKLAEKKMVSEQQHRRRRTQLAVARARLEQAKARVSSVSADLNRTLVLAPYAGSIVARDADEGIMATVRPNTRVVVLQESDALEAVLDVPEAEPIAVRPGDRVRLWVGGFPETIESEVRSVNREIDQRTRTYAVRAAVNDPEGTIKSGAFVRGEIETAPRKNALLLDRSAVIRQEGGAFVFRIVDGVVERTPVRLGVVGAEEVEILSGLDDLSPVVTGEMASRIMDGARVRLATAEPAAPVEGDTTSATAVAAGEAPQEKTP